MTGTGICHESSEAVTLAAHWLANTPQDEIGNAVIPALRRRFPLSVSEACEAAAMAGKIRRAQHGGS